MNAMESAPHSIYTKLAPRLPYIKLLLVVVLVVGDLEFQNIVQLYISIHMHLYLQNNDIFNFLIRCSNP